ncbi:MAG: HAD family hydrolase, partial [Thiomicrorhabdus sp.]|nr:HAD family hydrolase [Thiomicrorhabdus sp.]
VDETTDTGLLDILPPKANKRHAIEFLLHYLNYDNSEVVFGGDSGNDLEVLTSPIQSVLVANATLAVKTQAQQLVQQLATEAQFYQAVNQGNYEGNYSAGVLQGVVHFLPQFKAFFNEESA